MLRTGREPFMETKIHGRYEDTGSMIIMNLIKREFENHDFISGYCTS